MNTDTDDHLGRAQQKQDDIIRSMTPARRLEVARELYHTAWNLKLAALRRQHPEWSEAEVSAKVRRVFLTGYAGA